MPRKQIESRAPIDYQLRQDIYCACQQKCAHCGKHIAFRDMTIEHVIPLHKGGTSDAKNLVILCKDCNSSKSDHIIQPIEYYKHLPDNIKARVQTLFDEYVDAVDWFAHDNLFRFDQFDISVNMPIMMAKGAKIGFTKTKMRVQKLLKDDALNWLLLYTGRLKMEDKHVMPMDAKSIKYPYYQVTYQNKHILTFTAFIQDTYHNDAETPLKTITVQLFINPDLNYKGQITDLMLFGVLNGIMREVQHTLNRSKTTILMAGTIASPASDTYAANFFDFCCAYRPLNFKSAEFGADNVIEKSVIGLTFRMLAGDKTEYYQAIRKLQQNQDDDAVFAQYENLEQKLNANALERLAGSAPISVDSTKRKKPKKSKKKPPNRPKSKHKHTRHDLIDNQQEDFDPDEYL